MHWYYGNWNCGSSRSSRSINSTMSIGEHLITRSDGKANPVENRLNSMNSCCSHKSRNSFQRSYQIFFLTLFHQARYFVLTEYCFTTNRAPLREGSFSGLLMKFRCILSDRLPFLFLILNDDCSQNKKWAEDLCDRQLSFLTRSDLFSVFHSSITSKIRTIIALNFEAMFAWNYFQGTLEDLFPG